MHLVTQISGNNQTKMTALGRLLEEQQVAVVHFDVELNFLADNLQNDAWRAHDFHLGIYESIARSSFHTIYNDYGIISKEIALQIMYAMQKSKPIMLSELPTFADDVDTFSQRIIASRLHNFSICNLIRSDKTAIASALRYLQSTTKVDYALNTQDNILIRSKVRNHMRELVINPAQQALADVALATA